MTKVQILLATRNGAPFLQEQLRSYLRQDHRDWSLWVSDDASTDGTAGILRAFRDAHRDREVRLLNGPNLGLFSNFMHLLSHAELPSDYTALSDQDDYWLPHRLSRAVAALKSQNGPAFYCSTRITTDAALKPLSPYPPPRLPQPSLQNALVQNVAPGNTLMLNPMALALLREDPPPPCNLPFHDWWIYLRLMAAGATAVCDARPGLLYRQHANNILGDHKSRRLQRLRALLDGRYACWTAKNARALVALPPDRVLPGHRRTAEAFLMSSSRWQALRKSRVQRADRLGRCILPMLAVLNRV